MRSLTSLTRRFLADEDGAIIAEYGLLIAVLVLGLIVAIGAYRDKIGTWLNAIADNLGSNTGPSTP